MEEAKGGKAERGEDVGTDEDSEPPPGWVVGFVEKDPGPFGR